MTAEGAYRKDHGVTLVKEYRHLHDDAVAGVRVATGTAGRRMRMLGKDVIFILGSGRSGSSALTRVLSLCGCTLPQSLFGADEGNPKGFWEPADAAKLNLEFLVRHGWMTNDPTMRLQGRIACNESEKEDYVTQIRAFLAGCPHGPVLVVKEPLINELTDFWFEAARRERFRIKAVILIRHPHEVYASGAAFAPRIGSAAKNVETASVWWLRTNLLAERNTRNLPRVLIEHSNLMSDWRVEVDRVSKALSVDLQIDETAIDTFLTRNLHRQKCSGPIIETFGYSWTARVYTILSAAAQDGAIDVPALDEIYHAYGACAQALDELRKKVDLQPLREYFERRPIWRLGRDF